MPPSVEVPHTTMDDSPPEEQIRPLVSTLEAMLRVVTPDHPFQPVLAASIDPHTWQAVFVDRCKELAKVCEEARADDSLRRAQVELHDFVDTLFRESYFDCHHAAENPDRDATEFAPDDEFFERNSHWLKAKNESKPYHDLIQSRLTALKDRWESSCRKLANCLEIGPYASVLPVVLELARPREQAKPSAKVAKRKSKANETAKSLSTEPGLNWLSPVEPGPNFEREVRFQRQSAEVFVSHTLLPTLDDGVSKAFPEKGARGRGIRQEAKKRLEKAASDVLACAHLQWGWETLLGHATTATALHALLSAVRRALPPLKAGSRPTALRQHGLPLLKALRQIPLKVLHTPLSERWAEHLKDPSQTETVALAMQLLAHGQTYIGQDLLGKRLQGNDKSDQSSGWKDKAKERLRKLGTDMMAIHGSENWIHQAIDVSRSREFCTPRNGYGWLVNPLLVLWDPVYKEL